MQDPGDRAAWDEFDRRYREWLIRFFRRRNVPFTDSEDLVQRVFSSLATTFPRFTFDPQRGRFRDYLFRCARNAMFEWKNSCPKTNGQALILQGRDLNAAIEQENPELLQIWEQEWISHHYRMALATLRRSASERDIAILERTLAGATIEELARELEMETAALYKARQRIRERMESLITAQIEEEDRSNE